MQIKEKVKTTVSDLRLYWNRPPYGRYMSFKEIVSLSIGGMGIKFIIFCVANMILYVGNTLIGNTIGIPPTQLYAIYMISILAGFPLTALRAKMIDNPRNRKGKYRPYILSMGIPTSILAVAFTWMPYDKMSLLWKCVTVLLFNIAFQFFYNFLIDANDERLKSLYNDLAESSKNKDKAKSKAIKREISQLKEDKNSVKKELSKATKDSSVFNRAAKPFLDAKKLLIQQENYSRYEEIKAHYEESKERAEKERAAREELEAKQRAEKEAYAAKMKEKKKATKNKK